MSQKRRNWKSKYEPGFYWVKFARRWSPAVLEKHEWGDYEDAPTHPDWAWFIAGFEGEFHDDEIEVGPRIEKPESLKP